MSARSFVLLVVLAAICAEFPLTSAFEWRKDPGTEITQTYSNQKTLVLRWEWRLSGGEVVNQARITRYKTKDKDNTDTFIGTLYSSGNIFTNNTYFNLTGQKGSDGGIDGHMELTIIDTNNQGYNGAPDNSKVDVLVSDYTYELDVTVETVQNPYIKITKLIVYVLPGTPVLQLHPENPVFCQGDTINITCNGITGHPTLTNLAFLQNDSSIGMLNVTTSGNYTKTFSHALTQPGTFTYSCKATNAGGSSPTSNVVTITVKDSPVITSCTNKTAVEKGNLVWTCDVSGSQPLNISWFKGNNNTVLQSGRRLNIATVSKADDGMYRVTASNGGECPTASKTVYLDVQFPPSKPVLQIDPNRLVFCSNDTINVTCTAEAGDPPETNLTILQNTVSIGLIANRTKVVLNRKLTKAGTVSFSCQATNPVGSSPISAVNITVKDPPVITSCKNKTVKEKEDLVWNCDVSGSQPLTISWFKGNNNTVFQSAKSLDIATVSRADSGMYRFTASNGGECPTASSTVYLDVQYKPEHLSVDMAQNGFIDIDENDSVNITCSAKGNPEPYYYWVFNGKPLSSPRNDTITISNAAKGNAGKYTCTAVNAVGNETINVTVRVHYIGNITCDALPNPVKENQNLKLSCLAAGYPLVKNYTWTLPGSDVYSQATTVKANTSLNGVSMTCTALNSFGSKNCTKTITVYYKPRDVQVFPASVPALDINGSFSLTCNASANPDGSYTWSLNGEPLVGKTNRVLTKDNITLQDAGEYTCTVTNSEGSGASNKVTINVNYKPKIQKCAPVLYLSQNSSHVFHCNKADGFPAPSYTALYNGTNYNESVTIDRVTKALNGSVIRCSASNSLGSHSCNTTLIVGFLNLGICNNTLGLPTNVKLGLQLVGNPVGNPVPTLYCSSNSVKQINGSYFEILPTNKTGVSTCTLANNVTGCNFTVKVYQQVEAYIQEYRFRCSSCKWNQKLGDNKTEEFTRYKKIWEDILTRIYRNNKYVTKITVIGFWRGSVNVNFALTLIANVSDPLSPLKEEVQRNNGSVDEFAIDPNSIQSGPYVPQTTTKKPIITTTSTPKPITTPTSFPVEAIIGIAVGCALLLILVIILLVYCCYFKKRRDSKSEEHTFAEDGGNAVPMAARGIYNRGSSPSPSTYAKQGPGANGNNNVGNGGTVYAQEDKSKKTKKPAGNNEGEEDNSNKNGKKPENAEKESEAEEQAKDKNQDGSTSTSQTGNVSV